MTISACKAFLGHKRTEFTASNRSAYVSLIDRTWYLFYLVRPGFHSARGRVEGAAVLPLSRELIVRRFPFVPSEINTAGPA